MISQTQFSSKTKFYDSYCHKQQDCIIQLDFDSSRGLSIQAINNELLQDNKFLYITISDDTMNQKLKNHFVDIHQLYIFMTARHNFIINYKLGFIQLKRLKVVANKAVQQLIVVNMTRKQMNINKIMTKYMIMKNNNNQQRLKEYMNKLEEQNINNQKDSIQIKKQIKELNLKLNQNYIRFQNINGKVKSIVFLMLLLFFGLLLHNLYIKKDQVQPPKQQIMNQEAIIKKLTNIFQKEYNSLLKKYIIFGQRIKTIQDKFVVQQSIGIGQNSRSDQIMNIHNQVLIQMQEFIRSGLRQKQQTLKQLVLREINEKINENQSLKQKIYQNLRQKINNFEQSLNKLIDSKQIKNEQIMQIQKKDNNEIIFNQKNKIDKKLKRIQQKIQQLDKWIKKLSIFDLSSLHLDKFQLNQNKLMYIGAQGIWTQTLLKEPIIYQKLSAYKFKIVESSKNAIVIGLVDGTRTKSRSSLQHTNTLGFSAKGKSYKNGQMQQINLVGYQQGDVVKMQVQLSKGLVRWFVNQELKSEVTSQMIKDNTLVFKPYIQMASNRDVIQVITMA